MDTRLIVVMREINIARVNGPDRKGPDLLLHDDWDTPLNTPADDVHQVQFNWGLGEGVSSLERTEGGIS